MDNIQKLRETKNQTDADVILNKLRASSAVRKLVEVSFMTRTSNDRKTQEYGITCLNEAISTLKDSEQPTIPESPGLKTKSNGDSFVKEEELSNHNSSQRSEGSEQSTANTPPYPQEGTKDGDEDMTKAPDTENQMKEVKDDLPANILENTGLHPDIASKMGDKMPKIPPMDVGDQVKQMKYTVQEALKPLIKHIRIQDSAIKKLSEKIRETQTKSLEFNLEPQMGIRETVPTISNPLESMVVKNKAFELNEKRTRMMELNETLSQQYR